MKTIQIKHGQEGAGGRGVRPGHVLLKQKLQQRQKSLNGPHKDEKQKRKKRKSWKKKKKKKLIESTSG